ncbi:Bicyclomycin resistance protein [Vibrio mediterranei]|uniref:multidrug effflux MFS transporter n=1 Tax=Vibrio TaxID=662 RepID=UPI00015407FC|nr:MULTISPECIES: multidrug effflux MFS transporter [Vibrio]EDL55266.1 membrane transport protein [Vibrio mediterranei AK1]MCG9656186.1 multidrug effflux MFS transporter [Vibrio mediterranei]NUW75817.1 multidrug effflux MFS transporter [Vibrio mediterranei]USE02526.1 multidrug effflux MFS transporter [Vibrio sp. SCSIO 43133]SBO08988.1 Bicyclomycin resistance protein [Vibrio mediterranei]
MKSTQPILGQKGTLFFLVIISAFPPLTIDLYLPALPTMVDIFSTTESMVNLTLSSYFVTYAIGLLFWGPLSEKFGRKPILLIGIGAYMLASIACAMAGSIEHLIGSRVLQAFAGSAITVVSTAIVKDMFEGREREKIMATIMSLVIIAPMVAPVLGAFLLKVASWRMMFVTLAVFGAFASILAMCYRETLQSQYTGSLARSWTRLGVVMTNPRFVMLLCIFSIAPMALMAFLAAGSYIYINGFGLTEQEFSYYFAFNAMCASLGPSIYMKLSRHISVQKVITLCFFILALMGVLTLSIGSTAPWVFALIAAPATLMVIMMRVPGTNLMLDQQDKDTGSAVALIQFFAMICGSAGMLLVSMRPDALIANLGMIQLSIGIVGGLLWFVVRNRAFVTDKLVKSV